MGYCFDSTALGRGEGWTQTDKQQTLCPKKFATFSAKYNFDTGRDRHMYHTTIYRYGHTWEIQKVSHILPCFSSACPDTLLRWAMTCDLWTPTFTNQPVDEKKNITCGHVVKVKLTHFHLHYIRPYSESSCKMLIWTGVVALFQHAISSYNTTPSKGQTWHRVTMQTLHAVLLSQVWIYREVGLFFCFL